MTTTSDEELLELAANAAGYTLEDDDDEELSWVVWDENNNPTDWNPLTDDGDALRLAVKLELDIEFYSTSTHVYDDETEKSYEEEHNGAPYAATRRAIVRAAAERGKTL